MLRFVLGLRVLLAGMTFCLITACTTFPKVNDLSGAPKGWLAFPTLPQEHISSPEEQIYSWGELMFPEGTGTSLPAIILVHGSGGSGYTEESWANFLRASGFATFRVDYFGPRGINQDSATQPSPTDDVVAALRLLATHPRIDPSRISAIGFSRGALMVLNAGDRPPDRLPKSLDFSAIIALYPSCSSHRFFVEKAGAPVLVMIGSNDALATPQDCEALVSSARTKRQNVVELKVYEGAHHGWDGNWSGIWYQRAFNRSFEIRADAKVTTQSRKDVLEFLSRELRKN